MQPKNALEHQLTNRLPLTVSLGSRETGFSLMSRLAARNGIEVVEFGRDMGLPFKTVIDGGPAALQKLADLSGSNVNYLRAWSPHYVASRSYLFRGEAYHARGIRATIVRGCPACLREDAAASDLPPHLSMSIKGNWLPRHSTYCHLHGLPLIDLWKESNLTRRFDTSERFKEIAPAILSGEMDGEVREPTDFDEYLDRRLLDRPGTGWLDQHSLYAACVFCDLLGRALVRLEFSTSMVGQESQWALYQLGYEVAHKGEGAILEALNQLKYEIGEPWEGPKKKYGVLYDRLSYDLTGDDYAPFRALLRDHILETWPLGPTDELLGEPVLKRRKHSVITAADEVGIDPRRLRKLLAEAEIIGSEGDDRWDVFDADAAAPFLNSLNRQVSALELQSALNLSRSQFELLRKDGYFPPSLSGVGHKPLWDVAQARSFINDLLHGAETVLIPRQQWVDLAKASQRLKIRPGKIIQMITEGRLTRIGKLHNENDYASILVHFEELKSLLKLPDAPGMTIEAFARSVGLKPPQAGRLIKNGHTPATMAQNPKTRAQQYYMQEKDIVAFKGNFVTLRELAILRGQSWQSLRAALREYDVAPFSPDGLDYGLLYEWVVLEENDIAHRPQSF
ncbi:TniQ family protein [Salipiger sp. 1_MG-2023]|uniref:TniQ family protein n=1 Tax=Salipiger sp. 1_MG-2023 TaxID=3062665 RepID=UPI0026E2538C|nr:TniQ family protein [Salipiger sp. 1_MG-2023]MDO6586926.1 TniQ family protein [Salipiger sp. 1_MG-2023]